MSRSYQRVIKGGNFLKPKKWEDWSTGDFVEGIYEGEAEDKDLYGKPIYLIRVENSHFTGVNPTITSGDREGLVPLYTNGSLQMQLEKAEVGQAMMITYQGMATTSKGKFKGRPCHNIEVLIDGYNPDDEDSTTDDLLG